MLEPKLKLFLFHSDVPKADTRIKKDLEQIVFIARLFRHFQKNDSSIQRLVKMTAFGNLPRKLCSHRSF